MSENIFTAVLTFSLVAGGATVIGSEMFTTRQAPEARPATNVSQGSVEAVKAASSQVIVLPAVTIVGRADAATRVALAERSSNAARVQ